MAAPNASNSIATSAPHSISKRIDTVRTPALLVGPEAIMMKDMGAVDYVNAVSMHRRSKGRAIVCTSATVCFGRGRWCQRRQNPKDSPTMASACVKASPRSVTTQPPEQNRLALLFTSVR